MECGSFGTQSMTMIEQLAKAVLDGDQLEARAIAQELFETDLS